MQYEVYLDVLFLEKYDDGFSDSSGSKKKYFHVLPLMEVFLPVSFNRFTTDLCHFIFSMPVWTRIILLFFLVKFPV